MRRRSVSNTNNNGNDSNLRRRLEELKLEGDQLFRSGDYNDASTSYRLALELVSEEEEEGQPNSNTTTKAGAILQSNLVACYMKLNQMDEALEASERLVQEYPRWAKGYVRLASTYSALHRSNDACNALQRAIQLDPTHPTARSMLAQELRRRNVATSTAESSDATTTTNTITIEEEDFLPDSTAGGIGCWINKILRKYDQLILWYRSLNSDYQSLLLVILIIVSLYVAFGGRFGLVKNPNNSRLHRKEYNHNDHHYTTTTTTTTTITDYYSQWKQKKNRNKHFSIPSSFRRLSSNKSLLDGSILSMICLALILYCCQKFLGIQPYHAILMIHWMQRRGRGGAHQHYHPNFNRMMFLPRGRRNAFRF